MRQRIEFDSPIKLANWLYENQDKKLYSAPVSGLVACYNEDLVPPFRLDKFELNGMWGAKVWYIDPPKPTPRHHAEIAKMYYEDDSLSLEIVLDDYPAFRKTINPLILEKGTYRLYNREGPLVCESLGKKC